MPEVGGERPVAQTAGPGKYPESSFQKMICGRKPSSHWPWNSVSISRQARGGSNVANPSATNAESQFH
jgi:hypothetical protein